MNPENDRGAPRQESAAQMVTTTASSIAPRYGRRPQVFAARPRNAWRITCDRRDYCQRSEPLQDGRRDPDVPPSQIVAHVLAFGLNPDQLERERARLLALGWTSGEVAVVLGPGSV